MNKNNKIILSCYLALAIITISAIIYMNETTLNRLGNIKTTTEDGAKVTEVRFTKIVDINKKDLFETMANVKDYPIMLPDHFASVKIINQTNNTIYAQEEVTEKGIKASVLVRHNIIPYQLQSLEILSGDARYSTIIVNFDELDPSSTKLTISIHTYLRGLFEPFSRFTSSSAEQIMTPIIDNFVDHARGIDNTYKKNVDGLYMQILHRHADPQGLQHFASALQNGKMTINDVRNTMLNSDEYKSLFPPNSMKNDEIGKYNEMVDQLYIQILHRHADPQGLQHFASALQSGKMTINDVRNTMLNSDEYKSMQQK